MMTAKGVPSELIRARDIEGFDRWALPSFDEVTETVEVVAAEPAEPLEPPAPLVEAASEEIAIEAVKPLTLDELEAIRQDAYNEGFSAGEKDGFHAGQLKSRQEAEVALQARLQQMETLMQALMDPIAEQDAQLEQSIVTLVSHLCQQVIRRELGIDSSQIRMVLREALKLLPMGANNVRIHINSQDFEQVRALKERHQEDWRILEDESLLPGGCRVETEHSRIDASVETRMAQAIKQLLDQQREQVTTPPASDIAIDLDNV
jgi:flagellar assembly protein FliH